MDANAWVAFSGVLVLLFIQTAGVAFWMGSLSGRSKSNSARIEALERSEKEESTSYVALIREVATLTEKVSSLTDQVRHMDDLLRGANRQLASLVTRRKGAVPPLGDAQTEYDG